MSEVDEGVWLTKAELAQRRAISVASATKLIRRSGWRRQPGNDGRIRVLVPWDHAGTSREDSEPPTDHVPGTEGRDSSAAFETALTAIEAAHAAELAAIRAQADASEQGRIAVQELADRAMAQLADAGERADRADARADRLERDLSSALAVADRARADASKAQDRADELTRAEEARRGQGRWARLRVAWRGE